MATLFDLIERTDGGPAKYAEPSFPDWNRTARKDIAIVRAHLKDWFTRYPSGHQIDLRGRFRSPNDVHHRGAFFELFLHEMLLRLGCSIEIHPEVPGTSKRPEFRVTSPDGSQFYLEAKVVNDESKEEAAARVRTNRVYDDLNPGQRKRNGSALAPSALPFPHRSCSAHPRPTPSSTISCLKATRRFSPDGKRVHVFDQLTGKFRFSGTKRIAAEIEFYTMTTKDGTRERWIESRLRDIDAAVGIFGKLERGEAITREERWRVAFFIGFADSRGPGFRNTTPPLSARDNRQDDEAFLPRFANALAATTGVYLEPWVLKNMVLEDAAHLATGFDENSVMIAHGFELAMHLFWAEWLVGLAPEGATFITSDRPLGLLVRGGGFGDDAFDPNLIRVFPLSPRSALCIGRPAEEPSLDRTALNAGAVRIANLAVARRADRNIIASSEPLLHATLADLKVPQSDPVTD